MRFRVRCAGFQIIYMKYLRYDCRYGRTFVRVLASCEMVKDTDCRPWINLNWFRSDSYLSFDCSVCWRNYCLCMHYDLLRYMCLQVLITIKQRLDSCLVAVPEHDNLLTQASQYLMWRDEASRQDGGSDALQRRDSIQFIPGRHPITALSGRRYHCSLLVFDVYCGLWTDSFHNPRTSIHFLSVSVIVPQNLGKDVFFSFDDAQFNLVYSWSSLLGHSMMRNL